MENNSKSRIRISVGDCSIEIEGAESYVERKLQDHKSIDQLMADLRKNVTVATPTQRVEKPPSAKEPKEKVEKERKRRSSAKGSESYKILPDLDLTAKGEIPSLADFFKGKTPKSAQEVNPVLVYYLKKLRNIDHVGLDHIYTCYKTVGVRVPARLYQSIIDTRNRKGTVITDDMNDIRIGTIGENFVENDLPRQQTTKK